MLTVAAWTVGGAFVAVMAYVTDKVAAARAAAGKTNYGVTGSVSSGT